MTLPEPDRDGAPGRDCTTGAHRAPDRDGAPGRECTGARFAPGARFVPGPGAAATAPRETLTT